MTSYERLLNQVKYHCPESYAEYLVSFPLDPFLAWFSYSSSNKAVHLDKKRYDYCMSLAEDAIARATCEELIDVLYFISNEKPGGNFYD